MRTLAVGIGLSLILLSTTACDEWFNATPPSEMRGDQHFSTPEGFRQSLAGCYIDMANVNAYGKNLSWYMPELMGHQLQNNSSTQMKALSDHEYHAPEVTSLTEAAWSRLSNVIANANDALANLEAVKDNMSSLDYGQIRGEFLAIRAYCHLDLLRLYGYGDYAGRTSVLSEKLTVPYVTVLSKNTPKQITGAEFYQALTKDLEESAELLKETDPIAETHPSSYFDEGMKSGAYKYRGLHLNYYAVRALQARAYLWFGTDEALTKALASALEVIDFAENGGVTNSELATTIKFLKLAEVNEKQASMTREALFALQVQDLATKVQSYFVLGIDGSHATALSTPQDRVQELFKGDDADVRLTQLLNFNPNATPLSYTSRKFDQSALADENKDRINMIRLPEVYFIASEIYMKQGNLSRSVELLDRVRQLRGAGTLAGTDLTKDQVLEAIRNEYEREFIGEGVTFFQYKRWGLETIPMQSESESKMSDKSYLLPFPTDVIRQGYVQ